MAKALIEHNIYLFKQDFKEAIKEYLNANLNDYLDIITDKQ